MIRFIRNVILATFFISFLALVTMFYAPNARASPTYPINRVIVFGDSLSDNGNLFTLFEKLHEIKPSIPVIPSKELYWQGRFSDGPVWAEYFASLIGFMPKQINPEKRQSKQFQSFAYGGAWAETNSPNLDHKGSVAHTFPPPLAAQIETYVTKVKADHLNDYQKVLSSDLIVIWSGGNDYLNQIIGEPPIIRPANRATDLVIAAIRQNIVNLISLGGKHFLLLDLPDLSNCPDIVLRDPKKQSYVPAYKQISYLHNQKLHRLVHDLQTQYPSAVFSFLSIDQLFNKEYQFAAERKNQYALSHHGVSQQVTSPCLLESNDPDPNLDPTISISPARLLALTDTAYRQCDFHRAYDQSSPLSYLDYYLAGGIFFDHIHPVTQIHAVVALNACQLLKRKGYTFLNTRSNTYQSINCYAEDVNSLIKRIVGPPFPPKTG